MCDLLSTHIVTRMGGVHVETIEIGQCKLISPSIFTELCIREFDGDLVLSTMHLVI